MGKAWSREKAQQLYNVDHWSAGYFGINEAGELVAKPMGADSPSLSFPELLSKIKGAGLTLPVLVRFSDILKDRVQALCGAFSNAQHKKNYQGNYTCVYPIKVNQQRRVVEQLLKGATNVGLEAGSKPELMAVLALSRDENSVIVCNGYKDREYIRLALMGQALGHRVFLIVEKLSEFEHILEESQALGVTPQLGVRIRLSSVGKGKWQNSGGEKSKFGLTSRQIITFIEKLKEADMLDQLSLVHFHLGSQVANLQDIQNALAESAQYYSTLHALGVNVSTVDVGGGLGVDYEGTQSRSECSINYSLQEYADCVVNAFSEICLKKGLSHPDIITESGRALTAHHAVLVTQVTDKEAIQPEIISALPEKADPALIALWEIARGEKPGALVEQFERAKGLLTSLQSDFARGNIPLEQKACAEDIFYGYCHVVRERLSVESRAHRELLDSLNEKLADKLFCNFSLFQSIPDSWAINQIFPIMPLKGLLETPNRRAIIQDLTCDSDGRVNAYVDGQGIESSLPLPPHHEGEPYCLGIFLVGAYQEILGDMHNLFGDTDSVHVEIKNGEFELVEPLLGDRVKEVLNFVHFDSQSLMHRYKQKLENSTLSPQERRRYLDMLSAGLMGYTYLEEEQD